MIRRIPAARSIVAGLALALFSTAVPGCMERRETWTVRADASVQARLEFPNATTDELYDGDAVPSALLAAAETERFEAITRRAFLDVAPTVPQDVWLTIRHAMHAASENRDFTRIAKMFGSPPDIPPDERGLRQEGERFEQDVLQAVDDAVQSSQFFGPTKLNAFARRFAWHRRYHEVTEDLQDETFVIKVAMPGEIVGHNANTRRGSTVTSKFDGPVFADRDHELLVTSVVR